VIVEAGWTVAAIAVLAWGTVVRRMEIRRARQPINADTLTQSASATTAIPGRSIEATSDPPLHRKSPMKACFSIDLEPADILNFGAQLMASAQQFKDLIQQMKDSNDQLTSSANKLQGKITELEAKLASNAGGGGDMTQAEEDAAFQQLQDAKAAQDQVKTIVDNAVSSMDTPSDVTPTPTPPDVTPTPTPEALTAKHPQAFGGRPQGAFGTSPGQIPGTTPGGSPGSTSNVPPPHQGP
jgi:hypothetical protein